MKDKNELEELLEAIMGGAATGGTIAAPVGGFAGGLSGALEGARPIGETSETKALERIMKSLGGKDLSIPLGGDMPDKNDVSTLKKFLRMIGSSGKGALGGALKGGAIGAGIGVPAGIIGLYG